MCSESEYQRIKRESLNFNKRMQNLNKEVEGIIDNMEKDMRSILF